MHGKEEGASQEFRELFFQGTVSLNKKIGDNFFLERNTRHNFTVFVLWIALSKLTCFILPGIYFDLSHIMQFLFTLIPPWRNKKRTFSGVIVKKILLSAILRVLKYSFKYLAKVELED